MTNPYDRHSFEALNIIHQGLALEEEVARMRLESIRDDIDRYKKMSGHVPEGGLLGLKDQALGSYQVTVEQLELCLDALRRKEVR